MAQSISTLNNPQSPHESAVRRYVSESEYVSRFKIGTLNSKAEEHAVQILNNEFNYLTQFGSELQEILHLAAQKVEIGGDFHKLVAEIMAALPNTSIYIRFGQPKHIRSVVRQEMTLIFDCDEVEINADSPFGHVIRALDYLGIQYRERTILEVFDQVVNLLMAEVEELKDERFFHDLERLRKALPRYADLEVLIHNLSRVTFWLLDKNEILESISDDGSIIQTEQLAIAVYELLAPSSPNTAAKSIKFK